MFRSLKAIFPAWLAAIRDPEVEAQARAEWLKGLIENGINSDQQINAGLAKCRAHNSPFLPSIGQFITWCKESVGSMSDMPNESEARLAMIRELSRSPDIRAWEQYHPAVRWAYSQKQSSDWKMMSTKDLNSAFHDIWLIALKMAKENFSFEVQLPKSHRIEPIDLPPAPKEVALAEVSRLMSMFEPDETKPEVDNSIAKQRLQEAMEKLK